MSGGPVEKRGGGGEEEKLQPGGALQEHRAGDNDGDVRDDDCEDTMDGDSDDVMNDDCEDCDDDAAIMMVIMTSLQLSRS